MFGIKGDSVFNDFEAEELRNPCPQKESEGRTIYMSRDLKAPKDIGPPVLCDFSLAVFGDEENIECVQPNIYRTPEVILEAPWDYKIDIWNVGCMVYGTEHLSRNTHR